MRVILFLNHFLIKSDYFYRMNDGRKDRFAVDPFNDSVDTQGLQREWEEWFRSFELVVELRGAQSQHEKLVMMLAWGGRGLQRRFLKKSTQSLQKSLSRHRRYQSSTMQ